MRGMTAMVSGVVLVAVCAAIGGLAAVLAVAAYRRAGARDAAPPRDQGLSLPHDSRQWRF
jgi:hypothetical protein